MENLTLEQKMRLAKEAADRFFPEEKWLQKEEWGERIFVSSRRKIGAKSNFKDELRDAQILRDLGSTVYLVPEDTRKEEKQYDAIVDGLQMEFKNMKGSSRETLIDHFYRSRSQAPNVFFNLEKSSLSKHKIISFLHGARYNPKYNKVDKYPNEGIIIVKTYEKINIEYLNIDDL